MTIDRLGDIGFEEAIPERKAEAIIGIGFVGMDGVVNAVHIGSDDDAAQDGIQALRQGDIGVVEHSGTIEENLKGEDGDGWQPEGQDEGDFEQKAENDFDRMEADSCGHVDIAIAVVNAMNAPQYGDLVTRDMLSVDSEVEQDDGDGKEGRCGKRNDCEQPEMFLLCVGGDTDEGYGKEEIDTESGDEINAEIGCPSSPFRDEEVTSWKAPFNDAENSENTQKQHSAPQRDIDFHGFRSS